MTLAADVLQEQVGRARGPRTRSTVLDLDATARPALPEQVRVMVGAGLLAPSP